MKFYWKFVLFIALMILITFSNVISISDSNYITIELFKRESKKSISPEKRRALMAKKYYKLFKRDTVSPLINEVNADLSYYGQITIGGQNFTVDFDTGSFDLWVPEIQCSSSQCGTHNRFDPAKSPTFVPSQNSNFSASYGAGITISGYRGHDTVIFGGISVINQTVGLALIDGFSNIYEEDGILGLSIPIDSTNPGIIQSIRTQKLLNQTLIGFHLGRYKLNATDKSYMNLGGIDSNAYVGNIVYNNLVSLSQYSGTWTITLGDAQVDGVSIGGVNSPALIDTGTPFILGNSTQVSKILAMIPGSSFINSTWWIPCGTKNVVSLVFNNISYRISPTELIITNNAIVPLSDSTCASAIQQSMYSGWVVGAAFLSNVYSVFDFDNSKIGFAETKAVLN
ncbi:acid protease [Gigaspora margarita]|uniref:Acid protease n=1 Tax=Gigaspora margarita TaxID=4874 RepID=A0A8H4EJG6_GIGMA|nr:acid protease [Gigaspora margarita]